jgi:hypothetical protein
MKSKRVNKDDVAAAIIERIMSQPVPAEGQLMNPLNAEKKNRKSSQITISDIDADNLSQDVKSWTVRTFVDYFSKKWQKETGGNYKKTYTSDQIVFQDIGKFMASNGLEKNEWTKKFIDWCFKKRSDITKKSGHFMPQTIRNYLNQFYQDVVMPMVEDDKIDRTYVETPILDEIKQADADGKASEIFLRFGIPIAATYFVVYRGFKEPVVEKGLTKMIDSLCKGTPEEREKLSLMFRRSIIRSPYPKWFVFLNWREMYKSQSSSFVDENWWRDLDYRGQELPEYLKLRPDDNENNE